MQRVWLAGVLGGLAMFVWSSIAHMATPLGTTGITQMADDQPLLAVLQQHGGNASVLVMYPNLGTGPDAMTEYAQKLATSPSGLLLYHPAGQGRVFSARLLIIEFVTEVIEATLAAWLLAQARLERYTLRVAVVAAVGVIAATATNVPYWNWYGFPGSYTAASMFVQIVGFVAVGLVAARVLRDGPQAARVAARV
jgi:hypothetical protein